MWPLANTSNQDFFEVSLNYNLHHRPIFILCANSARVICEPIVILCANSARVICGPIDSGKPSSKFDFPFKLGTSCHFSSSDWEI